MATLSMEQAAAKYGDRFKKIPRAAYSRHGDFLGVILQHGDYTIDRVDEVLTLHRRAGSRDVIGFTLKGMRLIAEQILSDEDPSDMEDIEMSLVVLAAQKTSSKFSRSYACLLKFPMRLPRVTLELATS